MRAIFCPNTNFLEIRLIHIHQRIYSHKYITYKDVLENEMNLIDILFQYDFENLHGYEISGYVIVTVSQMNIIFFLTKMQKTTHPGT